MLKDTSQKGSNLPAQVAPDTYFPAAHSQRFVAVFSVKSAVAHVAHVLPSVQVAQLSMHAEVYI